MIYNDFLLELDRAFRYNSQDYQFDEDAFRIYVAQIDNYLFSYFEEKKLLDVLDMLKNLASGKTLKEVGDIYSLSQERIRQITAKETVKINSNGIVERNKHLASLFSFLSSINNTELFSFLEYLKLNDHVLIFILKTVLREKNFKIELCHSKEKYKAKTIKPREKFAPDDEIKEVLKKHFFFEGMNALDINRVASFLEDDYKIVNSYKFSGKVTWNKIVDLLVEMKSN